MAVLGSGFGNLGNQVGMYYFWVRNRDFQTSILFPENSKFNFGVAYQSGIAKC